MVSNTLQKLVKPIFFLSQPSAAGPRRRHVHRVGWWPTARAQAGYLRGPPAFRGPQALNTVNCFMKSAVSCCSSSVFAGQHLPRQAAGGQQHAAAGLVLHLRRHCAHTRRGEDRQNGVMHVRPGGGAYVCLGRGEGLRACVWFGGGGAVRMVSCEAGRDVWPWTVTDLPTLSGMCALPDLPA